MFCGAQLSQCIGTEYDFNTSTTTMKIGVSVDIVAIVYMCRRLRVLLKELLAMSFKFYVVGIVTMAIYVTDLCCNSGRTSVILESCLRSLFNII